MKPRADEENRHRTLTHKHEEGNDIALPDIITVEDLFGPPDRSGASLSPDGTRIAYLAPWKNRPSIWVQNLDGAYEPRCVTADEARSVLSYGNTTGKPTPLRGRGK